MKVFGRTQDRESGVSLRNGLSRIATPGLLLAIKVIGIAILIGGLQTCGFYRQAVPLADRANENLLLLQQEVPGNRLINAAMNDLRDYWRISDDEGRKRQIVELRESLAEQFPDNPVLAIENSVRVTSSFEAQSVVEQDILPTLQNDFSRLQTIYSDHYADAIAAVSAPPWYLWPLATLLTMDRSTEQRLQFNHAHYLALIGDLGAANSIYDELRQQNQSEEFKSRVLFAQARLQFDAFLVEPTPEYFEQSVQYVQQGLRHDATYDLPKLFLEFLLSVDQQAIEIDSSPVEGEGSGESEGERGAISTDSTEF